MFFCPGLRSGRRLDRIELYDLALGLRNDFLRDHNHVGSGSLQAALSHRIDYDCAEVIARLYFRNALDGENADFGFEHLVVTTRLSR